MALWLAGIPVMCHRRALAWHRFKQRFNYRVRGSLTRVNRFVVHWALSGDEVWETHWRPKLHQAMPAEARTFERMMRQGELRDAAEWRKHFAGVKVRNDWALIDELAGGDTGTAASRRKDSA
jgi:hypothetical protein